MPAKGEFLVRQATPADIDQADEVIRGVLIEDLGGYDPEIHWDVGKLEETYAPDRWALFVAVDEETREVIGTTAVRPGGPKSPPHPQWLVDRYDDFSTAQLFRVYIPPKHRRRGAARALVEAGRQFVADEPTYDVLYLHTDPRSPGAEAFWRSCPTTVVYDPRPDGGSYETLHFEMELPEPSVKSESVG